MYGAPELLVMTNNVVSPYAADVWALGITLLEVAMRRHPFAETTLGQLEQAVKERVKVDEGLEEGFRDLVGSMVELDWRKRPSAAEMVKHPYVRGGG